jgi:opacity protein-like surface antigen
VIGVVLLAGLGRPAGAQDFRIDAGGGWAFPTNNLTVESDEPVTIIDSEGPFQVIPSQDVDLNAGPHVYAGVGFVRSIGDNFELGARLRAHVTRLRSSVNCSFGSTCEAPDGALRVASIEGRIILTSVDWIHPYLLVGLGVVQTDVDGVTLRDVQGPIQEDTIRFPEVSIVDAGGDVGVGASLPLGRGFAVDAEIRFAGSLPGGKDNTVTVAPFTLGLAYTI